VLPITHPDMTRFNISLQEGVDMVLWSIENAWGGEILVPKIPSYRITDVASAVAPEAEQRVVGIRPGEKIHEEMITASDSPNTVDDYCSRTGASRVAAGFSYDSGSNADFLSVPQLREMISQQVSATHPH
jgi:FlaA1/EpsC-like NDP-sugar epimerase